MASSRRPSATARPRRGAEARRGTVSRSRIVVRAERVGRALSAHEHRTAAGLLALLVLVYLWPALVGGGLLAPIAVMYQVAPWQSLAPADLSQYLNPGLTDVPLSYYPWDVLARELIHAGTFPAWNPYALAGTPFFANPEVGWLSPFNVPLWVLPLNYALGVVAALKLWVAGFGAYLLVRELRLSFWPGMLAGVSFALCAFHVVWLSHSAFASVSVLLPWLLLLVERIVRDGRSRDGLALAGIVAVVLAGGHPGTQLHVLAAAVLYALVRAALSPDVERRDRLRRVGLVGGACALGALLMAVVLLPAQQAAIDSAGAAARRGGGTEEFHGASMPFDVLRTALFPEWWGRPSEVVAGPSVFNERTFYAGAIALVLAVAALGAWRDAWRRMAPFGVLAVLGVAVALEAPGLHALVIHLPLFDRVQNQRILLWFLLAVSVLAAFGLQALLDAPRQGRRFAWVAIGAAAVAALVAVGSIGSGGNAVSEAADYVMHRTAPVTGTGLALASVIWSMLFVAGLAAVLLLARARPRWAALVGALVVLLAALDMLHFAHGYQSMGPASKAIPPRTEAIAFLQRHAGEGRIAGVEFTVANDWSTVYHLRDARGYDAPQPSVRFHRLWQAINPEQRLHTSYSFSGLDPLSLKVLGLLGTRYIAAEPETSAKAPGLSRVYRGDDATVFENAHAMPRAIVASRVHVAGDEDEELAAIVQDAFDPRTDVVVRRDELSGDAPPSRGAGAGTARVVDEENSRVTLRATLPRRGVVVLDDAWAPGWEVAIDGRPARALQADMVLRGVVVPAGSHEVVWSYRVPGLRAGLLLSGLGLLIAAGWAGWLVASHRRRRFPVAPGP